MTKEISGSSSLDGLKDLCRNVLFGPSLLERDDATEPRIASFAPAELLGLLHLAEIARLVYSTAAVFTTKALKASYDGSHFIDRGAAQAGVAWNKDWVVVSVRGTGGAATDPGKRFGKWRGLLRDVWSDLRSAWRCSWSRLPEHATIGTGFAQHAEILFEEIAPVLISLSTGRKVAVIGHSLGAAVAAPLALALKSPRMNIDLVVTFESPRPGSYGFAHAYEEEGIPTLRVVNCIEGVSDIVTRIPPASKPFEGVHVGQPMLLAGEREIFSGKAAWRRWREENPVPKVAAWRLFTRLRKRAKRAVGAHLADGLVEALRVRAAASRVLGVSRLG